MNEDKQRLFSHLSSLYRDPERFPGAFKGISAFHDHLNWRQKEDRDPKLRGYILSRPLLDEWKEHDDSYTRFKATRRKNVPRRPYKILNPDNIWEGDLLDMTRWSRKNRNIKFILVLVDQFTKKLYASPCKSKHAQDVLTALRDVFEYQTLSRPRILYTDNGLEFTNALVQEYLTNRVKVQHVTTKNPSIKCAIAERTNRTLKSVLVRVADTNDGRYIDQLQNVVRGYNETRHTATGYAPNTVDPLNVDDVRQGLYRRAEKRRLQQFGTHTWDNAAKRQTAKLVVGDWVHALDRKQTSAATFRRGYDPSFPRELYQISDVLQRDKQYVYKLSDLSGKQLPSGYYYPELSKTIFPHKFSIAPGAQRQFTDAMDASRTKYKQIKIEEYRDTVWIPDRLLQERSAEDKRTRKISSAVFMHWLKN